MTAIILDGAATAAGIKQDLAKVVSDLSASTGVQPGLGSILVGDDGASATYVDMKHRACAEIGILSVHEHLDADVTQEQLHNVIDGMNRNQAVDAILLQLPLPKHLDEEAALLAVNPDKDVDGLHPVNLGRLVMGAPGPLPCTPAGIQQLLVAYGVPIEGKHVVVVGRGLTIGRPLSLLLASKRPNANAAVTVVHTGVSNMGDYTRQADIIVAAAGSPNIITPDMVKPGAAVVGGGVTRKGKRILSDVDESVAKVAGWITPRLGGVGPMTIAMLLRNTVAAAERRAGVTRQRSRMPVEGPQYPVNLSLQGRRCLVVGGGHIARRKIEGLLACDATVHVIAKTVVDDIRALDVTIDEREYRDGDMDGFRLVITATDDPALNQEIFREGERRNIWVNAADEPASCSFTLPAIVRRGPLMVAISTGGHSPALATWLKGHVQQEMGPEYEALMQLLSEERNRIKGAGGSTEDLDWQTALSSDLLDLVREGRTDDARTRLQRLLGDG